MTNSKISATEEPMKNRPNIGFGLGVVVIFGGVIAGAITDWENVLLLAYFYAYSFALAMFCIKLNENRTEQESVTTAALWSMTSFAIALPVMAIVMWLARSFLP